MPSAYGLSTSVQTSGAAFDVVCGMRAVRRLLMAHRGKIVNLVFFLVLGVGLVLGGSSYLLYQYRFAATAAHADGTVIRDDVRWTGGKNARTHYCPVVGFLTERQQPIQFTSHECSSSASDVGSTVEVLYDPDDPLNAKLDTMTAWMLRWGLGGVPIVVGLLFAVGSVRRIARARSRRHGHERGDRVQDKPRPPTA